jgi:hypothetical protein
MMSSAKESAIAIKVDQIDEQFAADAAGETARMPTVSWSSSGSHDGHISATHRFCALHRTKFPPKTKQVKYLRLEISLKKIRDNISKKTGPLFCCCCCSLTRTTVFMTIDNDVYEPDGKRLAPDWRQVVGARFHVQGLRAFAERRRAAILSSRLQITKNNSAPHYRAAEVGGAAGECGIFRQLS